MNFRKPTLKDRIFGALNFLKNVIINLILLDFDNVVFNWFMMKLTLKGCFEVADDDEYSTDEK